MKGATPQTLALASVVDLADVVFRVPVVCHLRVFLDSDPLEAESLSRLDSRGETVMMTIMAGSTTLGAHAVGLEGGRSDLIQTDESVTAIVLFKDGMEALRVPVELAPGAVNEIRL